MSSNYPGNERRRHKGGEHVYLRQEKAQYTFVVATLARCAFDELLKNAQDAFAMPEAKLFIQALCRLETGKFNSVEDTFEPGLKGNACREAVFLAQIGKVY